MNVFARDGEQVALDVYARGDDGDPEDLALGLGYGDATDSLEPPVVEFSDTTKLAFFEAGAELPPDYDFRGGADELRIYPVDLPAGAQSTVVLFDQEASTGNQPHLGDRRRDRP